MSISVSIHQPAKFVLHSSTDTSSCWIDVSDENNQEATIFLPRSLTPAQREQIKAICAELTAIVNPPKKEDTRYDPEAAPEVI